MVQKEVTLKIQADVDDSQVQDLESLLQQIVDGKITIPVETDSSELEEVEARIEELEQKRADIYMGVDDSDLEEVEAELAELEQRQIELTVNVDDSGLDELSNKMDDVESKSNEASDSISAIGGAAAGITAAAGLDQMITTADNINQSWDRLSLTLGRYGVTVDEIQAKQNQLTAATGRTGSEFRNFANTMSLAGIHDLNVIGDAFEAASAGAMKTNSSVEQVANSFQRMAMQGTVSARVLKNSGIEMQDLANVLGVSVDQVSEKFKSLTPEERLKALSSAMVNAKDANDMYKNSLQSMKAQADAAFAGLMGAVGQAILPMVMPAMQTLTNIIKGLTSAFTQLPGPVQSVIGGFGAVVLGATAITGALSIAGYAVKGLVEGFRTIKTIVTFVRELELATKAYTVAETIANGVRRAAAIAQAALNLVMAMNPYVLVALAILALIAALWYLYNTNEDVRKTVDGLYNALVRLCSGDWTVRYDIVQGGADTAIDMANNDASQWISRQLMGDEAVNEAEAKMPEVKERLGNSINEMFDSIWNDGTQGFLTWLGNIAGIDIMTPLQGFYNGFMQIPEWVSVMAQVSTGLFQGWLNSVTGIFNNVLSVARNFGSNLVSSITSAAQQAWNGFVNAISGMWTHMAAEVDAILGEAQRLLEQLPSALWNAAVRMVQGWLTGSAEHSPGAMYDAFEGEVIAMEKISKENNIASNMADTAVNMVNNFNPNLNNGAGGTGAGGTVINNEFNFTFTDFIDDKERLTDLIIKTIMDEINWDNTTANRTV